MIIHYRRVQAFNLQGKTKTPPVWINVSVTFENLANKEKNISSPENSQHPLQETFCILSLFTLPMCLGSVDVNMGNNSLCSKPYYNLFSRIHRRKMWVFCMCVQVRMCTQLKSQVMFHLFTSFFFIHKAEQHYYKGAPPAAMFPNYLQRGTFVSS